MLSSMALPSLSVNTISSSQSGSNSGTDSEPGSGGLVGRTALIAGASAGPSTSSLFLPRFTSGIKVAKNNRKTTSAMQVILDLGLFFCSFSLLSRRSFLDSEDDLSFSSSSSKLSMSSTTKMFSSSASANKESGFVVTSPFGLEGRNTFVTPCRIDCKVNFRFFSSLTSRSDRGIGIPFSSKANRSLFPRSKRSLSLDGFIFSSS
mmetsp:Transcript_2279/g.6109  ORF Transcript_2279/g.6109 Transcript_2279/m.6109 type:complete len:205 (+) Transcript_2279:638-1252(+)